MKNYVTQEYLDHSLDVLKEELRTEFTDIFVTKDDFHTRMDKMMTILMRLEQELTFEQEWKRRMESDITLIKRHLKLA